MVGAYFQKRRNRGSKRDKGNGSKRGNGRSKNRWCDVIPRDKNMVSVYEEDGVKWKMRTRVVHFR